MLILHSILYDSVAATVKRVCSIWFSTIVFGNYVTMMSGLGTLTVVFGVALYQRARTIETQERIQLKESEDSVV